MKPLDAISAAIAESVAGVLAQHGLVICRAPDTNFPLLDRDLDKLLREVGRNSAQSVAA
jgi:hypothetical protein